MNRATLLMLLGLVFDLSFNSTRLSAKVIEIQYATANPQGSAHALHITRFKTLTEKYSRQQMRVNLTLGGVLGSEHDNVLDTAAGVIHMTTVAVNNMTVYAPAVGFMTLPYIFPEIKAAQKLLLTDHPLMAEVNQKMITQANIRSLGWLNSGYRVLSNSQRPVTTPADLRGLKIRVPDNAIMVASYRSWGVEPIPIAWTKTFAALQSGMVDGQDNPYLSNMNMPHATAPFFKNQKYITNIHYNLLILGHIVNETFYQGLTPEFRRILDRAGREAVLYQWAWVAQENQRILKHFIANGMQLSQPADNEKQWIQQARSIWPQFYQKIGGQAFVDKIVKVIGTQ